MITARYLSACVELGSNIIAINDKEVSVSNIIPFSQTSAKVLRVIANERYDASSAKTKQDLINGLSLVGYKDGIPAATVKSAERKSRWS